MAVGPVHEGICPECGGDVETTRIDGRDGYWWRCRTCGWTFEATAYDAFAAAWAELVEAWRQRFAPVFNRVWGPILERLTRTGR